MQWWCRVCACAPISPNNFLISGLDSTSSCRSSDFSTTAGRYLFFRRQSSVSQPMCVECSRNRNVAKTQTPVGSPCQSRFCQLTAVLW